VTDGMLIVLSECCLQLGIDNAFVSSLEERGLIRTVNQESTIYINAIELPRLEKIVRLHEELEINIAGIEVVLDLTERIENLQKAMTELENRLRMYE
jgi:hypothetical protein